MATDAAAVDLERLGALLDNSLLTLPLLDNLGGDILDSDGHYVGKISWMPERELVCEVVNALPALLQELAALRAEAAAGRALLQSVVPLVEEAETWSVECRDEERRGSELWHGLNTAAGYFGRIRAALAGDPPQ